MKKIIYLVLTLLCTFALSAQSNLKTLKEAYKDYFTIGVAVSMNNLTSPDRAMLIIDQFSSMTAENDMKPVSTQPNEGQWNFSNADNIMRFASRNNIPLRGHCLIWHGQTGNFMFYDSKGELVSKEVLFERMKTHIETVMGRYKGRIYAWDVVNEAISDDPNAPHPYRESLYYKIAGDEFIRKAFEYAHQVDPDALLFYNDYNETNPMKRERIYNMVKEMKAAGVPIHGIGMQGHYNISSPGEGDLRDAINRYREVVDVIHVTELDVRANTRSQGGQLDATDTGVRSFTPAADAAQTRQYGMLFRVFRENKDVIRNVTFWNTDDRNTWLDGRRGSSGRAYPLLFDDNLKLKSAYYEVVMFDNPHRVSRAEMKPWTEGARTSGKYRNLFLEAGYTQEEIDKKIADAWYRVFESSYRVYQNVGDDMAYISDVKNRDIRTEGMSYGMILAAIRDKKDMFDRLWRWSVKYMQHKEGPRKGYFAWHCRTDGTIISPGTASDGELYYVTALLFASNRWGNDTGINYKKEAQNILNAMFGKTGEGGIYNIFNVEHKLITFTPDGTGWQYTDVSYHLPAFMEIWAEFADDGRSDFWRECAQAAREYLHKACDPVTGINPDVSQYDGSSFGRRTNFNYDSWRVPMNIAMDFSWYNKDAAWQTDYANRFLSTLYEKYGVENFPDQLTADGGTPETIMGAGGFRALRHSIGFVGSVATTALMTDSPLGWKFIDELWNQKLQPYDDGYYDGYYDGLIYLFALLYLSGQYQIVL